MILVIEILLTISAWRKGWKGWALLPIGIGMSIGFLLGMSAGATGGNVEDILPMCIFVDLATLISLIVLAAKAPRLKHCE